MRQPRFSPVTQIHKDRLEVWYAPVFLLEKYSLTFFSLIWFEATILNLYIKTSIIVATIICEIWINRKVNAELFNSRFFNVSLLILVPSLVAISVWEYSIDHDVFLFENTFVRMIYLYINDREILFSSSTTVTQPCLHEYEFFYIEKTLSYVSFGFFGLIFLRWIKLYVYNELKKYIRYYNNTRTESQARYFAYVLMLALLWSSYLLLKINLQYCVYNKRSMPIEALFFFIVIPITLESLIVFRWRLLINRETKPKEEVKDV